MNRAMLCLQMNKLHILGSWPQLKSKLCGWPQWVEDLPQNMGKKLIVITFSFTYRSRQM